MDFFGVLICAVVFYYVIWSVKFLLVMLLGEDYAFMAAVLLCCLTVAAAGYTLCGAVMLKIYQQSADLTQTLTDTAMLKNQVWTANQVTLSLLLRGPLMGLVNGLTILLFTEALWYCWSFACGLCTPDGNSRGRIFRIEAFTVRALSISLTMAASIFSLTVGFDTVTALAAFPTAVAIQSLALNLGLNEGTAHPNCRYPNTVPGWLATLGKLVLILGFFAMFTGCFGMLLLTIITKPVA